MSASISLTQSPPLSVPARYFITAPAFGVLAGALVVWAGMPGFSHRWMPAVLAATHLLTLGYMGMVMLGALMQVFPVVIGHPFRHAKPVSIAVHAALSLGVVLLAVGFMTRSNHVLLAALAMLAAAMFTFLAAAVRTLATVQVWGDTGRAIALALAAFAVMAGLGAWLVLGHASLAALPRTWTDIHAGWGLAGWVPLLLMGVAYQVVPMFQLTPQYPVTLRRLFPPLLFAMLAAGTLAHGLGLPDWLERAAWIVAAMVLAGFAVTTLVLQHRRRRSRPDVTVAYWRLGLGCLILAAVAWAVGQALPPVRTDARFALILGVLMIPGFSLSVINGMLYKIVPFLVWLHLAVAPTAPVRPAPARVPSVRKIIPEKRTWRQFRLHALALALVAAGTLGVPVMLAAGALVFCAACGWIGLDILSALRLYREIAGRASRNAAPRAARAD